MNERTHLAGVVLAGMWACPEDSINMDHWGDRVSQAVSDADALLSELAKTAKPEAEPEEQTIHGIPARSAANYWHDKYREAQQESSELRNKLTAATAQLEAVESEREHAETTANLLGAQLEDAQARVKELEAENKAMRDAVAENNELGSENIDLSTRVRELESDLDKSLARIRELIADKGQLEAALQTARAEGAKEERERLVKMVEANRFTVRCWNSTHPMSVRELRKALEPKP